ncbi:biopolymer transporter ExbD [Aquimarina sp. M1]
MIKYLTSIYFLFFLLNVQAQLPDQIELPEYGGKKVTYEHELAEAFLYVSRDNRIYNLQGAQIKNLNVITQKLKKIPKEWIHEVYIFADKRVNYKTIDKIKAAVVRSGIDQVVHMMRFTTSFKRPIGYVNKLYIPKAISDHVETSVTTPKVKGEKLSYQQIRILSDQKVRLVDGKELEISSKAYKKMINSFDVIAVDYAPNLVYEDYIFWLDKTQKILKKQKNKKRTIINELLVVLMKYDKNEKYKVRVHTN